jgi:hypothetical protein
MIKTILALFLLIAVGSAQAEETGNSQITTNWGNAVMDVRLSIGLSSNIVQAGSRIFIYTRIENMSTNTINLKPAHTIVYTLTNGFGITYQLNPIYRAVSLRRRPPAFFVKPGGIRTWHDAIEFKKEIGTGDYLIEPITRDITCTSNKTYSVISNSLKIKIVPAVFN